MGRVTRNPSVVGPEDKQVTFFSIVTKRYYENDQGEVSEDGHVHTAMVTNSRAGINNYVQNRVRKGDRVYLEGSLRYNLKEMPDGKTKKEPAIIVEDLILVESAV